MTLPEMEVNYRLKIIFMYSRKTHIYTSTTLFRLIVKQHKFTRILGVLCYFRIACICKYAKKHFYVINRIVENKKSTYNMRCSPIYMYIP